MKDRHDQGGHQVTQEHQGQPGLRGAPGPHPQGAFQEDVQVWLQGRGRVQEGGDGDHVRCDWVQEATGCQQKWREAIVPAEGVEQRGEN